MIDKKLIPVKGLKKEPFYRFSFWNALLFLC